MKHKFFLLPLVLSFVLIVGFALLSRPTPVEALPEYAAQTGEPCASCHISPSGGGARTPRGQAWVGSGKPGSVPDLVQALEALGVHLEADLSAYTEAPSNVPPAAPLQLKPGQGTSIREWLVPYQGN